jgi:hypothetical protein
LSSCYPNGPDYVEQLDLVISNYDPSFDFSSKQTFALPDNVIKITGEAIDDDDGNDLPDFVEPGTATLILNTIRNNMINKGWTEVDESGNPDVILLPSAMETTTITYYYDWWYWGWYYPGYPGYGWGWYYPGYYPPYVSSYTTGTLFIPMTDPNGLTPDANIPVVWTGVANGLLTGDAGSINSRITSSINQLFEQSPYLNQ